MRAAGVNVKGGHVLLAVVDEPTDGGLGTPVPGASGRILANPGLSDAARLMDLKNRLLQDLRAANADAVGLLATRSYGGWKYKDAYSRVVAICAVMMACQELGIAYEEIKSARVAKAVGVPAADLKSVDQRLFGFAMAPTYWTTGLAEAFSAAATVLRTED